MEHFRVDHYNLSSRVFKYWYIHKEKYLSKLYLWVSDSILLINTSVSLAHGEKDSLKATWTDCSLITPFQELHFEKNPNCYSLANLFLNVVMYACVNNKSWISLIMNPHNKQRYHIHFCFFFCMSQNVLKWGK